MNASLRSSLPATLAALALSAVACSSFDATKGHRYQCSREAPDQAQECPGGWTCTVDGVCADPAVGLPWTCSVESDCTGGWHCGVGGRCYDRADAGALACRATVPLDCAPGWRCGLDATCHRLDAGSDYLCKSDDDCEAGWRCGLDGRCANVASEALRVTEGQGTPAAELVWPRLRRGTVELVAISPTRLVTVCGTSQYRVRVAWVADAGVTAADVWVGERGGYLDPSGTCDGGLVEDPHRIHLWQAPLPAGVTARELAISNDAVIVLPKQSSPGPLYRYTTQGASLGAEALSLPFPARRLRVLEGYPERWAAFDDRQLALEANDGGVIVVGGFNDGGTGPFYELRDLVALQGGPNETILTSTDHGLFALDVSWGQDPVPANSPAWQRRHLPGTACADPAVPPFDYARLLAVSLPDDDAIAYAVRQPDTAGFYDEVYVAMPVEPTPEWAFDGGGQCPQPWVANHRGEVFETWPSPLGGQPYAVNCEPCGPNRALLDLSLAPSETPGPAVARGRSFDVEALCANPDGGPPETMIYNTTGCNRLDSSPNAVGDQAAWAPGAVRSRANPKRRVYAGAHGELWWSSNPTMLSLTPLSPSAPPAVVVQLGREALYGAPPVESNPFQRMGTTPDVLIRPELISLDPDAGEPGPFGGNADFLYGGVEGHPSWFAVRTDVDPVATDKGLGIIQSTAGFRSFSIIARSPPISGLPSTGLAATSLRADGGVTLMVAANDEVWGADIASTANDPIATTDVDREPETPLLRRVSIPSIRNAITSLTAVAADSDPAHLARYADAWAVAAGRVFHVAADSLVVWRANELVVSNAEAAELWHDGRRMRVGFRDGSIYSLPGRVKVAEAYYPEQSGVFDFETVCGHTFMLTSDGLFHLDVYEGQPIGEWSAVPLAMQGPGAPGTFGGRLWTDGKTLTVFGAAGWIERVSGFTCLP